MYQKYAPYQTAEFVADADFIEWVRRPTPQANQYWQQFLEIFPHQRTSVRRARQTVQLLLEESGTNEGTEEDARQIWAPVEENLDSRRGRITSLLPGGWQRWVAAAAITVLIGAGWWNNRSLPADVPQTYQALVEEARSVRLLEEVRNTSDQPLMVNLPDGSRIKLEKGSRVSFAKHFTGANREVYLTGAAFFEVTKNPEKPFLVYSNELVTKVLGTSFRIQAFEQEKNIVVSVKTGRVSVYAHQSTQNPDPETTGLLLTPNQEVRFVRAEERFNRTLVEKPTVLITSRELHKFSFEDAPVSRIFGALEKAYGVDIVFDEEILAHCRLTTSLSAETLFEKLEVICEGIGATYKVVDAQVVVSGRGCN